MSSISDISCGRQELSTSITWESHFRYSVTCSIWYKSVKVISRNSFSRFIELNTKVTAQMEAISRISVITGIYFDEKKSIGILFY